MARILSLSLALGALALGGCYDQGQGLDPPLDRIYFPTGIALSPGATRLYLVNSDFDLQYNGGAVQALDLPRIRSLVPIVCQTNADCPNGKVCDTEPNDANGGYESHWCVDSDGSYAGRPCGPFGEKTPAGRATVPGRCSAVSVRHPQDGGSSLLIADVGVGAFATDVIYRARPTGPGGRLFVPVRGDATMHYIEVNDDTEDQMPFELECGQGANSGKCDDQHRAGNDPEAENTRGIKLPPEPYGIDATADGEAIVITHQTQGAASLFVNDDSAWGDGVSTLGIGPRLEFIVGQMPSRPIGVAAIPVPALVTDQKLPYAPGFLVSFRDASQIDLLRYFSDVAAQPQRPYVQVAGAVGITTNSLNFDSRGVALDPSERQSCEAACPASGADRAPCLAVCTGVPVRVYVANRTPSSLLVGQMRPDQNQVASDDLPRFQESYALPFGPSRVVVGKIIGMDGQFHTRVFIGCFDSRKIGVFDPVSRIMTTFDTGRGPHAIAIDTGTDGSGKPSYAYAYIGHFTDSYLGVIDLDQRHISQYGTIVATIGRPSPPRASK